jgi:opacity protein-like surface antigen
MKKSNLLTIAVLAVILLLGANLATALEPIPKESGFGGFIRPGGGYLNYKSNMVASFMGFDLSEGTINSLDDSPNSQSTGIVMVPFSLAYTFASTRTQLFLGTDLTDLIRFDYSQQFGVKQEIGKLGILQGGILFSGIPAKVWKDPYVVNKNRDETSRTSNGGRVAWDRIGGSELQLQYTYRKIDVNSEKSGNFLGLTGAEKNLLERDGDRHVGEVVYRFRFAKKHTLNPAFIYTNDDRDGDAMKNNAYDFQLTYGYKGDTFVFTGNAFIGWADYDDQNPIYDRKQDDDRYGIQGALYYKNPWDWRLFGSNPMSFFVSAAFAETDSNIDFYDQEVNIVTGGVFFRW